MVESTLLSKGDFHVTVGIAEIPKKASALWSLFNVEQAEEARPSMEITTYACLTSAFHRVFQLPEIASTDAQSGGPYSGSAGFGWNTPLGGSFVPE